MGSLSDDEWRKVEDAVERLGGLIRSAADDAEDDELVCLQSTVDAIADACHQPRCQLPNDGWIEAGVVRARARLLLAALAAGEIRD